MMDDRAFLHAFEDGTLPAQRVSRITDISAWHGSNLAPIWLG